MKTQNHKANLISWKNMLSAAALGVSAIAPIIGMPSQSEAAPRDNVPAYGYRNRPNRVVYRTIEGVVTKDRRGNKFTIRTDNNTRVLVHLNRTEPQRLDEGDRVRVYGYYTGSTFTATSLTIVNNTGPSNNAYGRRTLNGVVTNVISGQRFRINSDGRIYDVITRTTLPRRLSNGDRVQVTGNLNGSVLNSAVVTMLNNNTYNSNYNQSTTFNFTGTVINTNNNSNTMWVRRDNGTTATVNVTNAIARTYRRDDRVRIIGRSERGVLYATSVSRL